MLTSHWLAHLATCIWPGDPAGVQQKRGQTAPTASEVVSVGGGTLVQWSEDRESSRRRRLLNFPILPECACGFSLFDYPRDTPFPFPFTSPSRCQFRTHLPPRLIIVCCVSPTVQHQSIARQLSSSVTNNTSPRPVQHPFPTRALFSTTPPSTLHNSQQCSDTRSLLSRSLRSAWLLPRISPLTLVLFLSAPEVCPPERSGPISSPNLARARIV